MRSLQSKLSNFYKALEDVSFVNSSLNEKRELLNKTILGFKQNISHTSVDKSIVNQNKEIASLLEDSFSKIVLSVDLWVENFQIMLEQEKFRDDLKNHFIVIIFGKVKAGKSSLGNFIARNNTIEKTVDFFRYHAKGQKQTIGKLEELDENSDGFATNNLECTIDIQGFTLGGLAWIDTPGLGSMVKENGDLAKRYIQAADYIIYPTSSGQPLQQDEIAQVQELCEQNKNITICITKSDETERRKGDDGKFLRADNGTIASFLINKKQDRRDAQELYVRNEVKERISIDRQSQISDIFSISSHTAQQGLNTNDEVLFEGSNIPQFYQLMTDMVEQKAQQIKSSTPYDNLVSFIKNDLLGNVSLQKETTLLSLTSKFQEVENKITEIFERFEELKNITDNEISIEVDNVVAKYSSQITKENTKEIFAKIDNELALNLSKIMVDNIAEILQNFTTSLDGLTKTIKSSDEFGIQDVYKTVKVWYKDRSLLNYVTFGLAGRSRSSMEGSVLVGNNKEEAILHFKQNRTIGYVTNAKQNYDFVASSFIKPVEDFLLNIKNEIKNLELNLNNLAKNLEKK